MRVNWGQKKRNEIRDYIYIYPGYGYQTYRTTYVVGRDGIAPLKYIHESRVPVSCGGTMATLDEQLKHENTQLRKRDSRTGKRVSRL